MARLRHIIPTADTVDPTDIVQVLYNLGSQGESEAVRRAVAADFVVQIDEMIEDGEYLPDDQGVRYVPSQGTMDTDQAMAERIVAYLKLTDEELDAAHARMVAKYHTASVD